jgi:hypothetical protein
MEAGKSENKPLVLQYSNPIAGTKKKETDINSLPSPLQLVSQLIPHTARQQQFPS